MTAIQEIEAERRRQIEVEGWTPEHDDEADNGQLAAAAACYATGRQLLEYKTQHGGVYAMHVWPWADEWWKPSDDRRRQLVKAGALIVAEIERLDRVNP